jgi:tyrosyl-tRNA synthetase
MTDFLDTLSSRGLVHQTSEPGALGAHLRAGPATVFCGFDATADSLHVGHLLALETLRRFAAAGHRTIVLVGTATTRVGDPSFRAGARPMLAPGAIAANAAVLRRQVTAVAGAGVRPPLLVDNAEWLDGIGHLDFLVSVGRHFNVARMLSFESVRARMDAREPLTFMEFGYMLLQAADFLELSRRHGCTVQLGGSDQWGNIVNGIELARKADGRQLHALTVPLLVDSSGRKMGKTAGGAVWLSADKTPAFDFWQFWRNVADADVARFLRQLTDLPEAAIAELSAPARINDGKAALADAVTGLVHGEGAARAASAAGAVFGKGGDISGLPELRVRQGATVAEALVAAGFCRSAGEARRLMHQGGARVDGVKAEDDEAVLDPEATVLSAGRKRLVRLVPA